MAKYSSADVGFVLVGGYDLLGYSTQITFNVEAGLEETHTLGDSWIENTFAGLKQFTFTQEGFYDDAAGASNAALVTLGGSSVVGCFGLEGNTVGKQFVGFAGAIQATYNRSTARGELHKANADWKANGIVEDGIIHFTHAAITGSTSNGTAVDNAGSSASGGSGYAQVSALTLGGYDNVVLKVQHSTDNSTYADLITFTVVTAAPAAQRSTVAGTVNRYTRGNLSYTGAGTGQSTTCFVGFKRN